MKKYRIIYGIIYVVIILLLVTNGIHFGIDIESYDDYIDRGIIDGFMGGSRLLIWNIIIISGIFIVSLITTSIKYNKTKYKWVIMIGIGILLLFVPVYMEHQSGGENGIINKTYSNSLNLFIEQAKNK